MAQQVRDEIPTPDNSTNFNVAAGSETPVGTTLENLRQLLVAKLALLHTTAFMLTQQKKQAIPSSQLSGVQPLQLSRSTLLWSTTQLRLKILIGLVRKLPQAPMLLQT